MIIGNVSSLPKDINWSPHAGLSARLLNAGPASEHTGYAQPFGAHTEDAGNPSCSVTSH